MLTTGQTTKMLMKKALHVDSAQRCRKHKNMSYRTAQEQKIRQQA